MFFCGCESVICEFLEVWWSAGSIGGVVLGSGSLRLAAEGKPTFCIASCSLVAGFFVEPSGFRIAVVRV